MKPIKKIGRPSFVPNEAEREAVAILRANGVEVHIIAKVIKIPLATLRKHYGDALKEGSAIIIARIGGALAKAALNGNTNAMIKWLVMRGGAEWRMPRGSVGLTTIDTDDGEVGSNVHFYMPPNGRDKPEVIPTIELHPDHLARGGEVASSSPQAQRALPQPNSLDTLSLRAWSKL